MSADVESESSDHMMMCCASCGVGEVDDTKLKKCNACKSVRYCSVKCQKEHRPKHKRECKKRAAELRDEILFKQPESSHYGDCPICLLPLPIDVRKSVLMACCSNMICKGCHYANQAREMQGALERRCPFCRHPIPTSQEECFRNRRKRAEANDPVAIRRMGTIRYEEGDYDGAFEYWTKAAGLGNIDAHFHLSLLYQKGEGVAKDKKKQLHHLEEAAIGGHVFARYNLGCVENGNGRVDRAGKHFIIAAKLGYDDALDALKEGFQMGYVSKEDFAAALRGHQAAVDETKSLQRETAENVAR